MSRECLAASLRMPRMSKGLDAKMFALARRKSMSTTSYSGSRVELTLNTIPSGAAVSKGTSLVCSVTSKLPACLAGESEPSFASFSMSATSDSSSANASACSTHSTSQSNACSIDEPAVMMPFGPVIFILR
jgi:hypothetical protein